MIKYNTPAHISLNRAIPLSPRKVDQELSLGFFLGFPAFLFSISAAMTASPILGLCMGGVLLKASQHYLKWRAFSIGQEKVAHLQEQLTTERNHHRSLLQNYQQSGFPAEGEIADHFIFATKTTLETLPESHRHAVLQKQCSFLIGSLIEDANFGSFKNGLSELEIEALTCPAEKLIPQRHFQVLKELKSNLIEQNLDHPALTYFTDIQAATVSHKLTEEFKKTSFEAHLKRQSFSVPKTLKRVTVNRANFEQKKSMAQKYSRQATQKLS